ncbi:hypothetical protein AVEN_13156-1 [Araneus ventricosus]|uniref:Uncharacterized protein n=1 Tax=Araneus ventricosus TaxID=182803 RepID=A0A4Y2T3N6_ARAVE|nr:hypothetical protein AVEN_13156-1 [Araneus ventricosus]
MSSLHYSFEFALQTTDSLKYLMIEYLSHFASTILLLQVRAQDRGEGLPTATPLPQVSRLAKGRFKAITDSCLISCREDEEARLNTSCHITKLALFCGTRDGGQKLGDEP